MLIALLGLNTEELRALVQEEGEPAYRATSWQSGSTGVGHARSKR